MNFTLKHYNTPLVTFSATMDTSDPELEILWHDPEQTSLLPLDMELTPESLGRWLRRRTIPKNRAYIHALLAKYGLNLNRPMGILAACKGLSLNDCYWVASEGDDSDFEKINLYENRFNWVLAALAFTGYGSDARASLRSSPEFTTNGMLPKCWRRIKGKVVLFKAGTEGASNAGFEPYSEALASAVLDAADGVYTDGGFEKICAELGAAADEKHKKLAVEVTRFAAEFYHLRPEYKKILEEIVFTLENAVGRDIFAPQQSLCVTRKPADKTDAEKEAGEEFKKFRDGINARYKAVRGDISDRETERARFLKSGAAARAFAAVLRDFDAEYTAIKRDENKLDYNDLEHLTLALLSNGDIRRETGGKYACVFVDEYQDVNPVQEEIITRIGGADVFLVGDVKQAIYGFRGSRSLFFAEKYNRFEGGGGSALRLSNNFRSSDGVIDFVNRLFAGVMTSESCGIDYAGGSEMVRGGGYPAGYGSAKILVFGREPVDGKELEVYSVTEGVTGGFLYLHTSHSSSLPQTCSA